jgi:hypothetical protein
LLPFLGNLFLLTLGALLFGLLAKLRGAPFSPWDVVPSAQEVLKWVSAVFFFHSLFFLGGTQFRSHPVAKTLFSIVVFLFASAVFLFFLSLVGISLFAEIANWQGQFSSTKQIDLAQLQKVLYPWDRILACLWMVFLPVSFYISSWFSVSEQEVA